MYEHDFLNCKKGRQTVWIETQSDLVDKFDTEFWLWLLGYMGHIFSLLGQNFKVIHERYEKKIKPQ